MITLLRAACCRPIARNAVQVSAVVGTLLNVINQGGALFGDGQVSWGRALLNYLVPYCVASFSAARNEIRRRTPSGDC